MFELYQVISKIENRFLREMFSIVAMRLDELDRLRSNRAVTSKTLKWKEKQLLSIMSSLKTELTPELQKLLTEVYKFGFNGAMDTLGISGSFTSVHKEALQALKQTGLKFMGNYTKDMIRVAQNHLYSAILTGEKYDDVVARLKKRIIPNAKRRIEVMVRDQVGRTLQVATWNSYKSHMSLIDHFDWVGPSDKRTTEYCRNRKKLNPWTPEEVQKLKKTNPKKYKGLLITDPNTGSFLHPHIQCRHVLVARTK